MITVTLAETTSKRADSPMAIVCTTLLFNSIVHGTEDMILEAQEMCFLAFYSQAYNTPISVAQKVDMFIVYL